MNINLAIAERARAGEALTAAEIDELGTADILSLGMLADEVRRARVGDSVTYPLTVTNTGAVPLFIQNVSDTFLGTIVSSHALKQPGAAGVNPAVTSIDAGGFNFSQPLASGASLTINVTRTVQAGAAIC